MKCIEWENKGILYFYNELENPDEYKKHIQTCKICQKNLEFLSAVKENISIENPSDENLENIYQTSFEIIKENISITKHRYIFNVFAFGVTLALVILVFVKIRPPKKSIDSEITYISERINEIEISLLQEESQNIQFKDEIEELNYQIKALSERIESL